MRKLYVALFAAVIALSSCKTAENSPERDYYERGFEFYKAGYYQNAYAQYKRAIEINPRYVDARIGIGYCYKWFGDVALNEKNLTTAEHNDRLAAYNFNEAMKLDSSSFEAHMGLGSLFFERKWFSAAVIPLERARELAPDSYRPYFYLGNSYVNLGTDAEDAGKKEEAKQFYQKAIVDLEKYLSIFKVDPKSDDIERLIEEMKKKING